MVNRYGPYWEWENPINPIEHIWVARMLVAGLMDPFPLVTGEERAPEPLTFLEGHHFKCHLAKLSVDHFTIIASFLEKRVIQSARLAGRELHFFLSPYLFNSVRFAPHKQSLDIVDNISKDQVLSQNVRSLRFDASICRLPGMEDDLDSSLETE